MSAGKLGSVIDELPGLLDRLEIGSGEVVFLQSSADHLGLGVPEAIRLIEGVRERLGARGTLLMPSYSWMPVTTSNGIRGAPEGVLDIRRHPSEMGLITEVFRRMPGTLRSEQFWLPVCGIGRLADQLLADQAQVVHPFGEDSVFDRLCGLAAKMLGLGVTLNTSSFSHLPDYRLERCSYPLRVHSPEPLHGRMRNHAGTCIDVRSYVVKPEIRSGYRPGKLFERSPVLRQSLRRHDHGSTIRISYPLTTYLEEAMRLGREAFEAGKLPPWLEEVDPAVLA